MAEDNLETPPRFGIGAVGAALALLALVGTAVAGTLAWRNQLDTVSTARAMAELQTNWTLAQRELESTTAALATATAELDGLRSSAADRVKADAETDAEITQLRDQIAQLERELRTLREQLAAMPEPEEPQAAPPVPEEPLVLLDDDDEPPVATLAPPRAFVFPDATLSSRPPGPEAPSTAVLTPRSADDPPSAWLLPAPPPSEATP